MAICCDEQKRLFTLETAHASYQMKVDAHSVLLHLYYGRKVECAGALDSLEYLLTCLDRGFSGNPYDAGADRTYSLDVLPQEYPTLGTGDYRNAALVVENADGTACCDLRYRTHRLERGKYALKGLPAVFADETEAETLVIELADPVSGVRAELFYGVLEREDIITRSVRITNPGTGVIKVRKAASACLDFPYGEFELLTFHGRHTMERNVERRGLSHGTISVGSRRGTSSHQYSPGVILAERGATEEFGDCYGMLFVYSGEFLCEAERDPFDQTRLLMGLQSDRFCYPLSCGESLTVPETILCYSGEGLGGLSRRYHACIRDHLCRGSYAKRVRPVLLNSWEAAYFDFTGETIAGLAREAAALGMDLVVMDDGWFGKREDDNSGLGDWQVNEKKLGCSLGSLIRQVNGQGVGFGIWIEPEMVSEDSRLYREHPDWALAIPGRKPVRSRNQLVLDFSRKEVRDHIFAQICEVLDQGNVEYVKWDMNRSLFELYSADKAYGRVAYDYMLGVYEFLERLLQRYPGLLLEGCSGGGGRFDAGMLYYCPQIWCSDNTDAIDRLRIQYGTSFFFPASTMGAHVSAVPNHQTGRSVSLRTRGIVAMAGAFGYELDPAKLDEEERAEIRQQIAQYKRLAPLILWGDYYRLSDPAEGGLAAWEFVSPDGTRALLCGVMQEVHGNMPVVCLRLKGLIPDARYRDAATGACYSGAALMYGGLPFIQKTEEYGAYCIELEPAGEKSTTETAGTRSARGNAQKAAERIYDALKRDLPDLQKRRENHRLVVSLGGGSGAGKSSVAALLAERFQEEGIGCLVVAGDNYPHCVPEENDAKRRACYEKDGRKGLEEYLGTERELDFAGINAVLERFLQGDDTLCIKKMGRKPSEIREEQADVSGVSVLILEWTHANSPYVRGVDYPILLQSTPEETKSDRKARNRDADTDSPFTALVLEIEQKQIDAQAHRARLIVARDGRRLTYQEYCRAMEGLR